MTTEEVRPCVYCGRPVPQSGSAGRPFRYCRDNDGACQRNARNGRMRERNSPGLAGQVARSWELVERLELVAGTLADALHAELSPAGVDRQTAAVRAEAATHVAGAHSDRDDARREAETARADVARLTDELRAALATATETRTALHRSTEEAASLRATADDLTRDRDTARSAAAAETALRADAEAARGRAQAAADRHRDAAGHADRQREIAVTDRDTAQATAERAIAASNEAFSARDLALADRAGALAAAETLRTDLATLTARHETLTAALTAAENRASTADQALAGERDIRRRTEWERDAARTDHATAVAAADGARADHLVAVTELADARAALRAALADAESARGVADRQAEQISSMAAALAARPVS